MSIVYVDEREHAARRSRNSLGGPLGVRNFTVKLGSSRMEVTGYSPPFTKTPLIHERTASEKANAINILPSKGDKTAGTADAAVRDKSSRIRNHPVDGTDLREKIYRPRFLSGRASGGGVEGTRPNEPGTADAGAEKRPRLSACRKTDDPLVLVLWQNRPPSTGASGQEEVGKWPGPLALSRARKRPLSVPRVPPPGYRYATPILLRFDGISRSGGGGDGHAIHPSIHTFSSVEFRGRRKHGFAME
ncbi:hypothetical protein WN55_09328 [Dufourea novaeangliae]|uniref:Uncharacterized protein n=1 Tax=Dufourea novaeangliae TaxID=178035 RepID=A0A154PAM2_DUFNO|nr:hypothetical protein WN55_09328 [Dufourea novaeangliae]